MYIPNLSVECFFICLSYFICYCALLLFCAQAWHGKTLSSRNDPIFFCSLHCRNLSLYNKITTTHFKLIRFWWKNVITFRGKVYSNFFKFVQQLFFLSVDRLVRDDRKATVTQITTRYNQGMQNTISEHTTHQTLKQMCYSSSRRPHRVPLLSTKNRKRRQQFTQSQRFRLVLVV